MKSRMGQRYPQRVLMRSSLWKSHAAYSEEPVCLTTFLCFRSSFAIRPRFYFHRSVLENVERSWRTLFTNLLLPMLWNNVLGPGPSDAFIFSQERGTSVILATFMSWLLAVVLNITTVTSLILPEELMNYISVANDGVTWESSMYHRA